MKGDQVLAAVRSRLRAVAVRLEGYNERGVTLSADDVELIVAETRGCADWLDDVIVASGPISRRGS